MPAAAIRSNQAQVRNPMLAVPGIAEALNDIPQDSRAPLRRVLLALRADSQDRAAKAWRTHKAPMALYWKVIAVYCGHLARLLRTPGAPE